MDEFKWYFLMVTVFIVAMFTTVTISEWRKMDCKLTLGQVGKTSIEIDQICN